MGMQETRECSNCHKVSDLLGMLRVEFTTYDIDNDGVPAGIYENVWNELFLCKTCREEEDIDCIDDWVGITDRTTSSTRLGPIPEGVG